MLATKEALAIVQHGILSKWIRWMFSEKCVRNNDGTLTVPIEFVRRWKKQMTTSYWELSNGEKDSDRNQTKLIQKVVGRPELTEQLSDLQHDFWSRWMKMVFSEATENEDGCYTLSKPFVFYWEVQAYLPHYHLSDEEKALCLDEADKILTILND